jgi:hypothetical protein
LGSRYSPIIVIGVPARARGIFMDHANHVALLRQ